MTMYLKAKSEVAFVAACESAGMLVDGEIITSTKDYQLWVIGEMHRVTSEGIEDEQGNLVVTQEVIEGYHANIKCVNGFESGLESLSIEVDNPKYKVAGE